MAQTQNRTPETAPNRGRPRFAATVRLENDLRTKGLARASFNTKDCPKDSVARLRMYNAAKRAGVSVTTRKVVRGVVSYIEGRVVDGERAEA